MRTITFFRTMALAGLIAFALNGWGQEILNAWNTNGLSGITPDGWEATTNADFVKKSHLSRGSGVTATTLANGFAASGWNVSDLISAKSGNKFFAFYIEAENASLLSLTEVSFRTRRTGTGPNRIILAYSLDGINFTDIGDPIIYENTTDGFIHNPIDLSLFSDVQDVEKVYFRLYGWGASSEAGTLAFGRSGAANNDLTITGTVSFSGATPPSISNIIQTPDSDITSETTVSVSAEITPGDAPISVVTLKWGTESGVHPNEINMTLPAKEEIYYTENDIPKQNDGTTVYYVIYAVDDNEESATSAQRSYTVRDPRFTTLPYEESFDANLGDCYVYTVAGIKPWSHVSGAAHANGYQGQAIEEHWLILPGINMDNYTDEILTFTNYARYGTINTENYLKLFYSTEYPGIGNPGTSIWHELSFDQPEPGLVGLTEIETFSGNIDLSEISGTSVFLAFKYYSTNSPTQWRVDDINIFEAGTPMLTAFPTSLSDFSYIEDNGPSAEQSFTVSGINLQDDISISPPANFEISALSGENFAPEDPLVIPLLKGTIEATPVYVRLSEGLEIGQYSGNIEITSPGAIAVNLALSGIVNAPPAPPLSIQSTDFVYQQDFNSLAAEGTGNSWADNETIHGWYWQSPGDRDPNVVGYNAHNGTSNAANATSFGETGSTERAMGAISGGSNRNYHMGVQFRNNSGAPINLSEIYISYSGEQWRQTDNAQSLDFSFSKSSNIITDLIGGTWSPTASLNFVAPKTGTGAELDGNAPENQVQFSNIPVANAGTLEPGEYIMISWVKTGTTSPGLAIDDFILSLSPIIIIDNPVFSLAPGTYFENQTVFVANYLDYPESVEIYYTLDGEDPDVNSNLYDDESGIFLEDGNGPITLKAIAVVDESRSQSGITTALYTFPFNVDDIAAFRAGDVGALYRITGEVVVLHRESYRNRHFVRDASGSLTIWDDNNPNLITSDYNPGDAVTGFAGTKSLKNSNALIVLEAATNPGEVASSGNAIDPLPVTINDLTLDHTGNLVILEDVTFQVTGTFTTGQNYPVSDPSTVESINFRTDFFFADYLGSALPEGTGILTGIIGGFGTAPQITARDLADLDFEEVIIEEPSNHVTNFTATANSFSSITVSWTDADAAGYLIKGSVVGFEAITAPGDGIPEVNAALVRNVDPEVETYQFTGLEPATEYFFKIFPYNGSGATINYKTDGDIPEASAVSEEAPAEPEIITLWDFEGDPLTPNVTNPDPTIGSGVASAIGSMGTLSRAAGSVTGCTQTSGTGAWAFGSVNPGTNESSGAQFKVSTVGFDNITFRYDQRFSNAATRTVRIQYTLDGTTWQNLDVTTSNYFNDCAGRGGIDLGRIDVSDPVGNSAGDSWSRRNIDFSTIPEANNNPNFGVRIVAAHYAETGEFRQANNVTAVATGGTWRFDNVTFSGFAIPPDVPVKLAITDINSGLPPIADTPFEVTVQAVDENNVPANVTEDTEVTLSLASGSGQLGGILTGIIPEGQNAVVFNDITYNVAEEGVSITATVTSGMVLDPATSELFEVLLPATHLAFVGFPEEGIINTKLSVFTVEARRMDDSVDPYFDGVVTLSIAAKNGQLNGTINVAAVGGIATFNNLWFEEEGVYTLNAEAEGLTGATSDIISIASGPEDVIAYWSFDLETLDPTFGEGIAFNIGGTSSAWAAGLPGRAWNTSAYPAQSANSATAGVQFMVSTVGYQDVVLSFKHRASGTASRWAQIEFTTDGGDTWNLFDNNEGSLSPHDFFYLFEFNFTGIPGANNNENFGVKIVSIFSPLAFNQNATLSYGPDEAYMRANDQATYPPDPGLGTGNYAPTGTWRFDDVTFTGSDFEEVPTTLSLNGITITAVMDTCFAATESIIVSDFVVEDGGSVTLVTGPTGFILLQEGVEVKPGGYLRAWIDLDENYCEQPLTLVAVKTTEPLIEVQPIVPAKAETMFKVYPNPTAGSFTLELANLDVTSVIVAEIYGMMGERLLSRELHGASLFNIDMSALPRGMYILRVLMGNQIEVQRIVKQ